MVLKSIKLKRLKSSEFSRHIENKQPVVFDESLFPGANYLDKSKIITNFIQVVSSSAIDDYLYIVPSLSITRKEYMDYVRLTVRALKEADNVIFKCYTYYDSRDKEVINSKETKDFSGYQPILKGNTDWEVRSAMLIAMRISEIYNTRVNLVSRNPYFISDDFLRNLIDNKYRVKPQRPSEFISAVESLECLVQNEKTPNSA